MKRVLVRKYIISFLAVWFCFSLIGINGFASGDVLYEWNFNDGSIPGSVKAEFTGGTAPAGSPHFNAVEDGKLVYDSSALAGGTYPSGISPRLSFQDSNVTAQAAAESVHTLEVDIRYDKTFVSTYYRARFGDKNFVSGITVDSNLFTIYANGQIDGGGAAKQLELGRIYKVSVVVDLTNTAYTKTLYVDGNFISTTAIATGNGSEGNKLFYTFFTLNPYASGKYVDTKIRLDNIKTIKGSPYLNPIQIISETLLYKAPEKNSIIYPFKAQYQYGETLITDGFQWQIAENNTNASVDANGNVCINNLDIEYFDLTVSRLLPSGESITRTVTINLKDGYKNDYQSEIENSSPSGWTHGATVKKDSDGNQYVNSNDGRCTIGFLKDSSYGIGIFQFRVRIPSELKGFTRTLIQFVNSKGDWYATLNVKPAADNNRGIIYTAGADNLAEVGYGQWIDIKTEHDIKKKTVNIYINGFLVAEDLDYNAPCDVNFFSIRNNIDFDDLNYYSGLTKKGVIHVEPAAASLFIPVDTGKSAIKTFAGQSQSQSPVLWWLNKSYEGVTIDPATGEVTITSLAAAGTTVEVIATVDGVSAKSILTLYQYYSSFDYEAVGTKPVGWVNGYGTVAKDTDGNHYVAPTGTDNSSRYTTPATNINGIVAVEADIRTTEISGSIGFALVGQSSWMTQVGIKDEGEATRVHDSNINFYYPPITVGKGWNHFKAILNFTDKTYTVLVNDHIVSDVSLPMMYVENMESIAFRQIIFKSIDADNVKIYHTGNTSPKVYHARLENVAAGKASYPSYFYLDESGKAEDCTTYQWYISDAKDGIYSVIEGATSAAYTPNVAEIGKFIKVAITPSSGEVFGSTVTTEPVKINDIALGELSYSVNGQEASIRGHHISEEEEINLAVSIPVSNSSIHENRTVLLTIAQYHGDQVKSVNFQRVILTAGEQKEAQVSADILIPKNGAANTTVKVFFWDGNLEPLMNYLILK